MAVTAPDAQEGRRVVIPAGTAVGPRERGDWIKLSPNEQAILRACVKLALKISKPQSAIRDYAPMLLYKLGSRDGNR